MNRTVKFLSFLVVVALAVSACVAPVTPVSQPAREVPSPETPAEVRPDEAGEELPYALDNQIILTGPQEKIAASVTANGLIPLGDSIDLKSLDSQVFDQCEIQQADQQLLKWIDSQPSIGLYHVANGTAESAIEQINSGQKDVLATRNLVFGQPLRPKTSDPGVVGPSPFTVGGSTLGSPEPTPVPDPAGNVFQRQWAFGPSGINLTGPDQSNAGVVVGVFDAFPDDDSSSFKVKDLRLELVQRFEDGAEAMAPAPQNQPILPPDRGDGNMRDHGTFVSSLIQKIAPDATLKQYDVIDDFGEGDLFNLNRALIDFIDQKGESGSVINLSLGLHLEPGSESNDADLATLKSLLIAAYCNGIVVVAAAGNDSADAPQLPAAWAPYVISVAASNRAGEKACFSNQPGVGGVLAPGGEGTSDGTGCEPLQATCAIACARSDDCDCDYALVGEVSAETASSGYGYWAGSSFSTALVTGLAARVLSEIRSAPSDETVARVSEALICGAIRAGEDCTGDKLCVVDAQRLLGQCLAQ